MVWPHLRLHCGLLRSPQLQSGPGDAETQKQSATTGIIYGLALSYRSCIVLVICLGVTILVAHRLCGMFSVALGALGMLGTMTTDLTTVYYGRISDNPGRIT